MRRKFLVVIIYRIDASFLFFFFEGRGEEVWLDKSTNGCEGYARMSQIDSLRTVTWSTTRGFIFHVRNFILISNLKKNTHTHTFYFGLHDLRIYAMTHHVRINIKKKKKEKILDVYITQIIKKASIRLWREEWDGFPQKADTASIDARDETLLLLVLRVWYDCEQASRNNEKFRSRTQALNKGLNIMLSEYKPVLNASTDFRLKYAHMLALPSLVLGRSSIHCPLSLFLLPPSCTYSMPSPVLVIPPLVLEALYLAIEPCIVGPSRMNSKESRANSYRCRQGTIIVLEACLILPIGLSPVTQTLKKKLQVLKTFATSFQSSLSSIIEQENQVQKQLEAIYIAESTLVIILSILFYQIYIRTRKSSCDLKFLVSLPEKYQDLSYSKLHFITFVTYHPVKSLLLLTPLILTQPQISQKLIHLSTLPIISLPLFNIGTQQLFLIKGRFHHHSFSQSRSFIESSFFYLVVVFHDYYLFSYSPQVEIPLQLLELQNLHNSMQLRASRAPASLQAISIFIEEKKKKNFRRKN
ncbi:putative signal peptide protein [Puccinia sorghi]|uniref:Putative signal peptide protein n=1 Tax=Puccinia sorghi TaxID=27349 RepID=A0A0L6VAN5_9BASI|nr:putative signal peptide protein [Puccinia sorghi]